jgi:L-arabinokinase
MIPAWMFERVPHARVEALETDTGLVQIDSLHFDEQATAERTAAFYRDFDRRVDDEASWLREHRVELVVGDIPPLAFAAADRAEIPSVAFGNFTWDWIYSAYAPFETDVPEVIPIIRRAYAKATRALRLPFHGGFEPMRQVVQDVPLVARKSRRDARETRHTLGVREDLPLVLASFGAYGAALPHAAGTDRESFTLLNIAQHPPHGLAYEDVVAAADVVVSKPGYGIVSECIANQTALLYTSRGQFVEYDCFVDQMPRVLRCRFISQGELLRGEWSDAIRALLDQPAPPDTPRVDGAEISADIILGLRPD